jgi:NAD(P)-dependent dehydrogenase (short-subunit alcohol dehydrogenase family)
MKSILITGVSTGIGLHTASHFLKKGWRVFGSVRKEADARALLTYEHFIPLIFDVTDDQAINNAADIVTEKLNGESLDMLVNNAGIAISGPLMHLPIADFEYQMNVNVTGVIRVTQAFLPLLGARLDFDGTPGTIVNIGSVSGRFATPFLGPYTASKHALEAISDALRRELVLYRIPVSLLQPAAIKSEIWEKGKRTPSHTEGTDYVGFERFKEKLIEKEEKQAIETDRIAEIIWKIAKSKKPKARYLITRNNLVYRIFFSAPDSAVDYLFRNIFKHKASTK